MNRNKSWWRESLHEIFTASPVIFVVIYVLLGIQGILTCVPVICLQMFFDEVIALGGDSYLSIRLISALVAVFAVKSLLQILSGVGDYLYEYHELVCAWRLGSRTNEKAYGQPGIFFEKKTELENLEKAYQGAGSVRKLVDLMLMVILKYFPGFLVLGWYLYRTKPILVAVLLLLFVPSLLSYIVKKKMFRDLVDQTAPLERKINAYCGYMTGQDSFKETRLLGIFSWLFERTTLLVEEKNRMGWTTMCRSSFRDFGVKMLSVAGYFSILMLLYQSVQKGDITIGCFSAIFAYLDQLFSIMEEMVYETFGRTAEVVGKIEAYFRFHNRSEEDYAVGEWSDPKEISLENVSFRYPNISEDALKEINITIAKGEHIAIVGENGSGKSTLVKILTGFYVPTIGRCCYNGKEIVEYQKGAPAKKMSAVFQNFGKYQMSLRENVRMGNYESGESIEPFLREAGLETEHKSFPQGEETMLSREFDGVDLSGGQWQRVALARGWYRPCEWIFLDEPTSAIDPMEEMQLYQKFEQLADGKTMVLVTHRMGAVRSADRILVLKKGRLVGQGSHELLLQSCSEYQRLWNAQALQYH